MMEKAKAVRLGSHASQKYKYNSQFKTKTRPIYALPFALPWHVIISVSEKKLSPAAERLFWWSCSTWKAITWPCLIVAPLLDWNDENRLGNPLRKWQYWQETRSVRCHLPIHKLIRRLLCSSESASTRSWSAKRTHQTEQTARKPLIYTAEIASDNDIYGKNVLSHLNAISKTW